MSFHLTPSPLPFDKDDSDTVPGISSFDVFSASIALHFCPLRLDLPKILGGGHAWMSRWKCWDQRLGSVVYNPN